LEDDASIHLFFVNLHSKLTQRDHLKIAYLGALLFLVLSDKLDVPLVGT